MVQVWIENHINVFNGLVGNAIRDQAINMNDKMGLQIAKSYSKYLDVLSFKKDNYDALLGFVIHVAVSCNDVKFMNFVADKMVPGNSIKDPVPAFNVACLFAVLDRKDEMLKAIKVAKKLGKRSEEFATEDNFKKYFKDPDFKMTIKGK